jgi:hypothetical protein
MLLSLSFGSAWTVPERSVDQGRFLALGDLTVRSTR